MDRRNLLWQLTAQQFAAFDMQLYLDTHPHDTAALGRFNEFQKSHAELRRQYESLYGPLSADRATGRTWDWVSDPWPWEREVR